MICKKDDIQSKLIKMHCKTIQEQSVKLKSLQAKFDVAEKMLEEKLPNCICGAIMQVAGSNDEEYRCTVEPYMHLDYKKCHSLFDRVSCLEFMIEEALSTLREKGE